MPDDFLALLPAHNIARRGSLPNELLKVLYGFDAVVILSGSGPQHDSLQ